MTDKTFLCVVQDRASNKMLADYTVAATDWYYARHQARRLYEQDLKTGKQEQLSTDWWVDSIEIE